jgi:superfamily II DNA or RNA helicase
MNQILQKLLTGTIHRMAVYIRSHYRTGKKVLREKQMNVFEAVHGFLKKNLTSGYIKLPTGTGKTVLFGQIIRAVANHKSRALILVPRIQLVEQTYKSLKTFAPKLSVGRINTDYKEYGNQITVCTYTSWVLQIQSGKIKIDDYDYIILDEGHRALTPNITKLVEKAKKKSIILGFSATPGFSAYKHLNELLIHEIYTMELGEAIHLGLLVGVRVMLVELDVDLSNTASKRGDYETKDLEKLINTNEVNNTALKVYKKYFKGECTIIYANSVQHVHDVVATFVKSGIKARGIHGGLSKKVRGEILHDYHLGKFSVLVNCDLLSEGFDEPRVSVCLNLRPTQSAVFAEQRGGRVLRLDPDNPNKIAHVVDFIYKESTRRKLAILFSEITCGAIVLPEHFKTSRNLKGGAIRDPRELLEIDGLKIIYDVHTIDELTKGRVSHNSRFKVSWYPTWKEARKAVEKFGIYSRKNYSENYKKDPRLCSLPSRYYKDFPGWSNFLGKNAVGVKYSTWEEASVSVRNLGLTYKNYYDRYTEDPKLPRNPQQYYPNFPGFSIYFYGKKKPEKYATWEEASKAIKKLKIDGRGREYRLRYKEDPKLPADLKRSYQDFPGWENV